MTPNTNIIHLTTETRSYAYHHIPDSGTLKVGVTLPVEAAKAVEHAKREPSELDKVVKEITSTMAEERTLKNKAHNLTIKYFSAGISIGFAIGLIIGCLIGLEL